ncbi:hypothetical protein Tco_1470295 [Tanacetum coccineum]
MNMELVFMAKKIAQPGMNMGQERQMQMVGGNGRNQCRQYTGQNVGIQIRQNARNKIRYNARNQIGPNARQNHSIQNACNQNGLIVVLAVRNQNGNAALARVENNGYG